MKLNSVSFLSKLLILQYVSVQSLSAQEFGFFYFIQQWPGAICDSKQSCCFPKTGKPTADFTIAGLRPNFNDGSFPSNCNIKSVFDKSKISDIIKDLENNWPSLSCPSRNGISLWSHEWMKHGTCSESTLSQHNYFQTAIKLKRKLNLLQILKNAGIEPDNKFYNTGNILDALQQATGYSPGIECNRDSARNSQLYQVYMCADISGSKFIECPGLPIGSCEANVQFPKL